VKVQPRGRSSAAVSSEAGTNDWEVAMGHYERRRPHQSIAKPGNC
jgi:hypothetical protein